MPTSPSERRARVGKSSKPRERRPFQLSGTLDMECADWSKFAVAATYDGHRPKIWRSLDALVDHLRTIGGTYYAHAGGVYDLLAILDCARTRGIACQVDRSQHRVTRVVMGKLTLRDSYAIWPVPLEDIRGALQRPSAHLPWACICGRKTCPCGACGGCGGYCQITERALAGDPDLDERVKRDAIDLYDGLQLLQEFAQDARIFLRGTLGHTAWVAAQDELGVPDSDLPWHLWRHAKRGDKGGRITIVRPRAHGPGAHHDICNAYPAQLAKAHLPIGPMRELGGPQAMGALSNQAPGIYTLTVRVPDDSFLPPLPWNKAGMLAFPIGEFTGSWALPEIVCALERDVEIVHVHSAIVWEATAPIFAPLVERWYEIRRKIGRKTPMGQWIGRLAKVLTGKFAERPERSRVTMHPAEIKICTHKGACRRGCTKKCGAYEQMDLFGHIWTIPYSKLGPSAYPHWSAYLRAMTRVQWLEQAERFGRDLVMGNTDSLWHTSRLSPEPLGDNLGEWEYQHAWWDMEVRSPTTYAFRPEEHAPLEIRGVPGLSEEDWKRGAGVIDRGIVTLGRAAKSTRGLFQKRHRRWSLPEADRLWYGDRQLGTGGITYPAHADQLRELVAKGKERQDRKAITR